MKIDIEQVKELMRALRRYGLSELEIRQGEERITLRREGVVGRRAEAPVNEGAFPLETGGRSPASGLSMPPPPMPTNVGAAAAPEAVDDALETITAPLVGTFYRSSAPGAKAFADVGMVVRVGQIV